MTRGIDWAEIFKRRPDLEPPGYKQTVQAMLEKRNAPDVAKDDRRRKR